MKVKSEAVVTPAMAVGELRLAPDGRGLEDGLVNLPTGSVRLFRPSHVL